MKDKVLKDRTSRYRFLLTPRWIAAHLLVAALLGLFVNLGLWQLRRLDQRTERSALLETRLAAEPQPLAALTARYDVDAHAAQPDAIVYRRARLTGRYDVSRELLLRSRAHQGQPGYHVLTPLVFEPGRALLVDRGWVPYEMDKPPVMAAAPPTGEVTVTGILFADQPQPGGAFAPRDPAEGSLEAVFWIDTARLETQLPYRLEPLYLELTEQAPPQASRLPIPPAPPELGRGPHLSYALQWFSFALIGLVGYPLLIRGTAREQT